MLNKPMSYCSFTETPEKYNFEKQQQNSDDFGFEEKKKRPTAVLLTIAGSKAPFTRLLALLD